MPPVGQLISGPSGSMAFLLGSGTVMKKELADGEKILLSTEALVAFTDGMSVDVRTVGSCTTCCFGGEGCFNTVMTGPGTVYVHSFGLEKLKKINLAGWLARLRQARFRPLRRSQVDEV